MRFIASSLFAFLFLFGNSTTTSARSKNKVVPIPIVVEQKLFGTKYISRGAEIPRVTAMKWIGDFSPSSKLKILKAEELRSVGNATGFIGGFLLGFEAYTIFKVAGDPRSGLENEGLHTIALLTGLAGTIHGIIHLSKSNKLFETAISDYNEVVKKHQNRNSAIGINLSLSGNGVGLGFTF